MIKFNRSNFYLESGGIRIQLEFKSDMIPVWIPTRKFAEKKHALFLKYNADKQM